MRGLLPPTPVPEIINPACAQEVKRASGQPCLFFFSFLFVFVNFFFFPSLSIKVASGLVLRPPVILLQQPIRLVALHFDPRPSLAMAGTTESGQPLEADVSRVPSSDHLHRTSCSC